MQLYPFLSGVVLQVPPLWHGFEEQEFAKGTVDKTKPLCNSKFSVLRIPGIMGCLLNDNQNKKAKVFLSLMIQGSFRTPYDQNLCHSRRRLLLYRLSCGKYKTQNINNVLNHFISSITPSILLPYCHTLLVAETAAIS